MAYPNAADIRQALQTLATANSFCSIRTLLPSVKGVPITALVISKVTEGTRAKVLFTGGNHANELAPPRAILKLMQLLLGAYKAGTGITYGAFSVTAQDIKDIVEHVDIYAAPMINPDGYASALAAVAAGATPTGREELIGRKNGRATGACTTPLRPGVNINRNFDILWDFTKHYAPAPNSNVASSTDRCDHNYTGFNAAAFNNAAFSEPESKNVKTLLDDGIQFYVDCHMYGPKILVPWGVDESQTSDSNMWFGNANFDGIRNGTVPPLPPRIDYKEFILATELAELERIANLMAKAVKDGTDVPGRAANPFQPYQVQPSSLLYPLSGGADDYAFSRHRKDPTLPFVRAYTIECGNATTGFWPTDAQYASIEQELHCALLSMLLFVSTWIARQNPPAPPPPSTSTCPIVLLLGAFHPGIEMLRHLRDVSFRESGFGCSFIDAVVRIYAAVAPPLARWLAPRRKLQRVLARAIVEPAVGLLRVPVTAASRLPLPSLRVAALIAAVTFICGLPLAIGVILRSITSGR